MGNDVCTGQKIYLDKGFNLLPITLSMIVTPRVKYQYRYMQFGLCNAPAHLMDIVLKVKAAKTNMASMVRIQVFSIMHS